MRAISYALLLVFGACDAFFLGPSPNAPPGGVGGIANVGTGGAIAVGMGGAQGGAPGSGGAVMVDPREARCQNEINAAWSPLRRVTHEEYENSLRRLFTTTLTPTTGFPKQAKSNGFTNGSVQQGVGELLAESYFEAAEAVAADVVRNVSTLLACDVATLGQAECGRRFVTRLTTMAFRRTLSATEAQAYQQLLTQATMQIDFNGALEVVVLAVLQSPHFLYHFERGTEIRPGLVKLDGSSIAARLATALWQSLPDNELLAAAARGDLDQAAGVATQARRMVADDKSKPVRVRMFSELTRADELGTVTKDLSLFANWESSLRLSMAEESQRFVDSVLSGPSPTIESLFTARHTFVNTALARHYGLPAVTGWQRVDLAGTKRLGLMTQGSILAVSAKTNQSSPTLRGLFVRENLLCDTPPPPPQNANIVPPDPRPGATTRERFAEHQANPDCAGCHQLMDPIGLGFENFDAVGAWRDTDEGRPVDASGDVIGSTAEGAFNGVEQLATRLATTRDLNICMSKQHFRYFLARHEFDDDTCSLYRIEKAMTGPTVSLPELVVSIVSSDSFRYRKVDP
jgi:hypothetical protein